MKRPIKLTPPRILRDIVRAVETSKGVTLS
jgi:hypothetical protein